MARAFVEILERLPKVWQYSHVGEISACFDGVDKIRAGACLR
jgi:hypothetical protein